MNQIPTRVWSLVVGVEGGMAWRKVWSPAVGRCRGVCTRERESRAAARVRSPGSLRKPIKYDCFLLD